MAFPGSPSNAEGPVTQNRLDYSFVVLTQLARVLETPTTRKGERYNRLLELASLLHPYQDDEYRAFSKDYFAHKSEERIQRTLRWLSALTDLMSRAGLLGRRDARE